MEYMFFIRLERLKEQGLSQKDFYCWYLTSKRLCREEKLYVTLGNKKVSIYENIAGYVKELRLLPGRATLLVKIGAFDDPNFSTDAHKLLTEPNIYENYFCQIGKKGEFFTLSPTLFSYERRSRSKKV